MNMAFQPVKTFLEQEHLHYFENDQWIAVPMNHPMCHWIAFINICNNGLLCTAEFPLVAHPRHRCAITKLLASWNWNLLIGSWEIDRVHGFIRFRTSVSLRDVDLTVAMARNACEANFCTFSEGVKDILAVLQGRSLKRMHAAEKRRKAQLDAAFQESMRNIGFGEESTLEEGPPESGNA